jgi:Protein of unknown function (DUF2550)
MPVWEWLADSSGVLLLLLALYAIALVFRRRWISRNGGTFEFSVRVRPGRAGRGWILGVARYTADGLEWFRIFSLAPRPRFVYRRSDLEYVGRRDAEGVEGYSLYSGHIVVTCRTPSGLLEVAMSPDALTGFLAWLEAAPPGRQLMR